MYNKINRKNRDVFSLWLRNNCLLEFYFPVSFGKVVNLPGTAMALPDKIPHDFTKHLASVVCNYIALFSSC